MENNPDLEGRWAIVWCDFSSDGLWNARGRALQAGDMPLSPNIRDWLLTWQGWYDAFDPPHWFDHAAHCRAGIALARAIKAELADWTIIATIVDDVAMEMALPPSPDWGHYAVANGWGARSLQEFAPVIRPVSP